MHLPTNGSVRDGCGSALTSSRRCELRTGDHDHDRQRRRVNRPLEIARGVVVNRDY